MLNAVVLHIDYVDDVIHCFFEQIISIYHNVIEHLDLRQFLFGRLDAHLEVFGGFGVARFQPSAPFLFCLWEEEDQHRLVVEVARVAAPCTSTLMTTSCPLNKASSICQRGTPLYWS